MWDILLYMKIYIHVYVLFTISYFCVNKVYTFSDSVITYSVKRRS